MEGLLDGAYTNLSYLYTKWLLNDGKMGSLQSRICLCISGKIEYHISIHVHVSQYTFSFPVQCGRAQRFWVFLSLCFACYVADSDALVLYIYVHSQKVYLCLQQILLHSFVSMLPLVLYCFYSQLITQKSKSQGTGMYKVLTPFF